MRKAGGIRDDKDALARCFKIFDPLAGSWNGRISDVQNSESIKKKGVEVPGDLSNRRSVSIGRIESCDVRQPVPDRFVGQ